MLDETKRAETDQAIAQMEEVLPAMIWGLYEKYQESGFTEPQSFELVKIHVLGIAKGP